MDRQDFLTKHLAPSVQHRCFYHFTDKANLASIAQHGLLSMREIRRRGLIVPNPGGDAQSQQSDLEKGTDDYVCLCFTRHHPMSYVAGRDRGLDVVYLKIHPNVILHSRAMLTLEPSNKTGVERVDIETGLDQVDLEVLYRRTNWAEQPIQERLRAAEKYELLIPNHVPVSFLMDLNG